MHETIDTWHAVRVAAEPVPVLCRLVRAMVAMSPRPRVPSSPL